MPKNRALVTTLLALTLLAGAGLAEEAIVTAAKNTDITPGSRIDGEVPIELAAGASLTLVTLSGRTVNLSGPFSGPPAPAASGKADARLLDAVGKLVQSEQRGASAGGFRAGPGGDNPDDWRWIDPARSGDHCLPKGTPAVLWRSKTGEEVYLDVRGPSGNEEIWWEEDEATTAWPEEVPLADGQSYSLRLEGAPSVRRITFHQLPAGDADLPTRLDQLIAAGCQRQAWLLLATLPEGE